MWVIQRAFVVIVVAVTTTAAVTTVHRCWNHIFLARLECPSRCWRTPGGRAGRGGTDRSQILHRYHGTLRADSILSGSAAGTGSSGGSDGLASTGTTTTTTHIRLSPFRFLLLAYYIQQAADRR